MIEHSGLSEREVEEVEGSGGAAAGGGVVGSMMAAAGAAVEKVKVGGRAPVAGYGLSLVFGLFGYGQKGLILRWWVMPGQGCQVQVCM